MDNVLTKAASLGGIVAGFLNHHIGDLNAVSAAMQGILAALPVNAETRANIDAAIQKVQSSADNITASLAKYDALQRPEFHISESDIAKALSDDEGKAILSQLIADYLAKHPQVGTVAVQQDQGAATVAEKGAIMAASDRSGPQQMGETVNQSVVPQDGVSRNQDAPVTGDAGKGVQDGGAA